MRLLAGATFFISLIVKIPSVGDSEGLFDETGSLDLIRRAKLSTICSQAWKHRDQGSADPIKPQEMNDCSPGA